MAIKTEEITVRINKKNGTAIVSVAGISGPSCTEVTRKLQAVLGTTTDIEQTDEFFQEEKNTIITK